MQKPTSALLTTLELRKANELLRGYYQLLYEHTMTAITNKAREKLRAKMKEIDALLDKMEAS